MIGEAGIGIIKSTSSGWQESVAGSSTGFTPEHAVVLGVFGVILLLMIARKRGWGSRLD
ncbi:MAG: hypothetical protein HOE43_08075 [Chloroflexi bacterium]|jgi:hypothetical protein|nr:hypothetical protein [Chloroflexota bacterium]